MSTSSEYPHLNLIDLSSIETNTSKIPLINQSATKVSTPCDIESVLEENGYIKLVKLSDTLQGELLLCETLTTCPTRVAIKRCSKALYANKVSRESEDGTQLVLDEDILSEALLLCSATIKHKCPGSYLCRFVECFHSDTDYFLVMEYVPSRLTLRDFALRAHEYIAKGAMDKKEWARIVKFIAWQLIVALHFLHTKCNIAHLDLTMDNIMVVGGNFVFNDGRIKIDRNISIKVVDFGLATQLSVDEDPMCQKQHPQTSTFIHKSPQIYNDEIYDAKKSDIWSLGLIVYRLMFNCAPYQYQLEDDTRYAFLETGAIIEVVRRKNENMMPVTVKLVSFLENMLRFEEKGRFDISELLHHNYLKSYFSKYKGDFEEEKTQ